MKDQVFFSDNAVLVQGEQNKLCIRGPFGKLEYALDSGLASIYQPGAEEPFVSGIYAEAVVNGQRIRTPPLKREEDGIEVCPLADSFGSGVKVTVRNHDSWVIRQNYYVYGNRDYFFLDAVIAFPGGASSSSVAPLVIRGAEASFPLLAKTPDPRFLFVPFDNDEFVSYDSHPLDRGGESYEATALFDNSSRRGVVVGSVTHDTWKTGVEYNGGGEGKEKLFRVYGGITSFQTRDVRSGREHETPQSHGEVAGEEIASPRIFWGFCDDWRDGLEEYGRANGLIAPPLAWDGGPPFGWNSWSAVADKVDYGVYTAASDFLKEELPEFKNSRSPVYINFDSFWDRLTEEERKKAAAHVKANGQKPGIYHTPFTYWGSEESARRGRPEGAGDYTWYDILLKDAEGEPLPYMHGKGFPLDPTHPGTTAYNTHRFGKFLEWGFEYAKLDFMTHGAMEGAHYEKTVSTGIMAYNYGMRKILDFLGDRIKNQEFFLSLSIAPVFPSQYAHGRRISCDIFGEISCAEYMLNSLTYGWWLNNAVYPWNDPDHIVVYTSYNRPEEKGPIQYHEGMTRYVSSAIAGAFMIDSDDVRTAEARRRLKAVLNNTEVNALAASGRTFRPVEGNTGSRASAVFVRDDRARGGDFYLAVFNYSAEDSVVVKVDLERLGAGADGAWRMKNLIDGAEQTVSGTAAVALAPAEPKLFSLSADDAGR